MMFRNGIRETKIILVAAVVVALAAGGTVAEAQDRDDRWEFGLGLLYQGGTDIDSEVGSDVETDDDFGFQLEAGYNFTDNFAVKFGSQWTGVGYQAEGIDENGDPFGISGSYDQFALFGDLVYYFGSGALAPYVSAGIGWTWVDTNVPSGPPITGCWWDPWYGYVCYTTYPTKTTDAFSYQASVGLRYEFNYSTFLDFGYTSQWLALSNADGTPRFDVFSLEIGWMF
ncbi:MAG: outer membrane beta-barrel protein [Thermoanaerobaculales bacterium]|nr:outer membrane beta-barrel protein [Thermoanaerobaculales bacterium]